MPYSTPSSPATSRSSSPTGASPSGASLTRTHRRRSSGSFTDEKGPGAFAPLGALPRTQRRAAFHINVDDDDDVPPPPPSPPSPPRRFGGPFEPTSLRLSMTAGRFSPAIAPPSRIELPPPSPVAQVPFPTSSPLTPTDADSPFIPRSSVTVSAASTPSTPLPRTPSSSIILSNGKPLKPSLKSSASSPHIPGLPLRTAHLRVQSAPSTPVYPKAVHFPEDPALESVRVFSRSGKPASLSKPPGDETETETEAEPSTFPFPSLAPSERDAPLYELRTEPGASTSVPVPSPPAYANAHLETLSLPRTSPPALRGTVLVRNIAFEKTVAVRFTLDDWQTTSEVLCKHVVSLPGLPPPFSTPRTVGDLAGNIAGAREDEGVPQWDRFSFVVRLEDYAHKLTERTLFLAVRYTVPWGEWWDNNSGANYRCAFKRAPAPAPATRFESSLGLSGMGLAGAGAGAGFAQQRSFAAPSTLRNTPTTAEVAALTSPAPAVPHRLSAPALTRSHSSPLPSPNLPVFASPYARPPRRVGDTSPVLKFVARKLSLSNYAAPHASPASTPAAEPEEQKSEREMVTPPDTPPETPPGSVRMRKRALLPAAEPDALEAAETASVAAQDDGPEQEPAFDASVAANVVRQEEIEDVPIVEPEGAGMRGTPSAMSPGAMSPWDGNVALEPGLAGGILSPPDSPPRGLGLEIAGVTGAGEVQQADVAEGQQKAAGSDSQQPSPTTARTAYPSFNSFPRAAHARAASAPDAFSAPSSRSASPLRSFPPAGPAQYSVSDPNYAELIRQWCFGGSAGPSSTAYVGGYGRGYGGAGFGALATMPDAGMVGAGAHMR